ncbi:FAD-dependent oxidoreductase, partial [Streptomyces milbemycinicus]
AAGLTVARGVVVDDQLRTSDPRIFAIGDCAEHAGVLYGLAGPAQDQADVLAQVVGNRAAGAHGWAQPGHRAAHGDETGPRYAGSRAL